MAIFGLKLKDIGRIGRKLEKGVGQIGRGISKAVSVAKPFVVPIAGAIGGSAGEELAKTGLGAVEKLGKQVGGLTQSKVLKGVGRLAEKRLPALEKKANIMIGDVSQQLQKKARSIQAE